MAFTTKLQLSGDKFGQLSGETLTLDGTNIFTGLVNLTAASATTTGDNFIIDGAPFSSFTASTTTANNGLTKIGDNIVLGGALTGDTNIDGDNNSLSLTDLTSFSASTTNDIGLASSTGKFSVESSNFDISESNFGVDVVGQFSLSNGSGTFGTSSGSLTSDFGNLVLNINTGSTFVQQEIKLDVNSGAVVLELKNGSGMTITSTGGAKYAADYSSSYTPRSLVDAEYVTGLTTSSGIQTANNGLTKTGTNVQLGGTLTDDTVIGGASTYCLTLGSVGSNLDSLLSYGATAATFDYPTLNLNGDSTNKTIVLDSSGIVVTLDNNDFRYAADYSANYTSRSLTDKAYVDTIAAGLDPKESVRVATVAAITGTYVPAGGTAGSGQFTGVSTTVVDGITLVDGNRILVKNQADAKQNGIYERISATVWNRATDQDGTPANEVSAGNFTFIETGNTLTSTGWVTIGDGELTLNTDDIVWVQFNASSGFIAGDGINISGTTISVDLAANSGLDFNTGALRVAPTIAGNGIDLTSGVLSVDANNGLTANGPNVQLGGTLTGDTTILSGDNSFVLGGGNATGANSTIIGGVSGSYAYGDCSHVIGYGYVGTGAYNSMAIGTCARVCDGAYNSFVMGYNSKACSPHTVAIGTAAQANGFNAIAIGGASCAQSGGSVAIGIGTNATIAAASQAMAFGSGTATGVRSKAWGFRTSANGVGSLAIGDGTTIGVPLLLASGGSSINISHNNSLQTAGHGALASGSTIFGGQNHNIEVGNTRAAIVGGNLIKLTGTTYIDTTAVGNLAVMTAPSAGIATDNILVRRGTTGKIFSITQASIAGSLTASNGIQKVGSNFRLGGSLTGDTCIDSSTFGLSIGNSSSCATGANSFASGRKVCALGNYSTAFGDTAKAFGDGSVAFGGSYACGSLSASFNGANIPSGIRGFAANSSVVCAQNAAGFGSSSPRAAFSFAAGCNNIILSGNTGAAVIGGENITLTGTTYIDTTAVDNLAIISTPSTGLSGDSVLIRRSTTGIIHEIAQSALVSGNINLNVLDVTIYNTSTTLVATDHIVLVNSSGVTTMTLPASPVDGQVYHIKDKSGNALTNTITIAGNGNNIDGASTASINTDYGSLYIVYSSVEDAWFSLAFIN